METLTNMIAATEEIEKLKAVDNQLRFRIETCVHKGSIKLYVIKKEKILQVITIGNGSIIDIDKKVDHNDL